VQSVHICSAIILCITHQCLSSENQTVSTNVKSESNDLKSVFNLTGNVTKSLDKATPAENHTKAQRNTSEDGEQLNKETYGVKPGELITLQHLLAQISCTFLLLLWNIEYI